MYPVLFQIPDVLGFDLYPLQVWCRPAFGDVFDAQHELHDVSGGKPTFQWIEVARMEQPCRKHSELDPTPATVRAETWLSIAGGATRVGYFPNHWSGPIGQEITRTNREIKALTQALLAPGGPGVVRQRHGTRLGAEPQRRPLRHRREHELVDDPGEDLRRRASPAARQPCSAAEGRPSPPTTRASRTRSVRSRPACTSYLPAGW